MLKKRNINFKIILAAFTCCILMMLPVFINSSASVNAGDSASGSAGSADDPLVTLSYINKVFKPQIDKDIDNAVEQKVTQIATQIVTDKLKDFTPNQNANVPQTTEPPVYNTYVMSDAASSSYVVVELTKGQKLRVKSGSLELILRPGGTATVISEYKTQGIADLTTGDELLNGKSLPINHSLLIPRADGRGITITSVIAYIMVRGDYEIY